MQGDGYMIDYLMRRTNYYRIAILFFLLSLILLVYLAYQKAYLLMLIYFGIQVLVLIILLMRMLAVAKRQLDTEWIDLVNEQLDPQALLDRYESHPKVLSFADVIANRALCFYLLGDYAKAIFITQEMITKEKSLSVLLISWLNISNYYDANQEFDMGKQALEEAKKHWGTFQSKKGLRTNKVHYQNVIHAKETFYAYLDHHISYEEYLQTINQRLTQEVLTRRTRMQLRYTLACIYLQHGDLKHAEYEMEYLNEFARKTYFYNDVQTRWKKLKISESAGEWL